MDNDKIGGTLADDECRRCDVPHDMAQPCKPMARGWRAHAYRRAALLAVIVMSMSGCAGSFHEVSTGSCVTYYTHATAVYTCDRLLISDGIFPRVKFVPKPTLAEIMKNAE